MLITDKDLIKNAVTTQATFMQSALGRTITQSTTINGSTSDPGCASGGSSAFSAIASVVICVSNPGWTVHDALNKQKILMHETFHVLQYEMHWLGHPNQDAASAHWIDEGTAEYMGWRGAASAGLVSFETARQCMVAQANAQASASQNLSTMETGPGFGIPGAYQVAMLGIDQLVNAPGTTSLAAYGNAIAANTAWQTAFQTAFGTSTTAFYSQFVSYRTGLGAGASSCGT